MKYNRLTKRIANDEEAFLFHSSLHEGIERLAELEDKIESGEIVDRNEYLDRFMAAKGISRLTDKEIEFFAKHNARVRGNADAEIARLTAQNAELRERLEKAIELPCKVEDNIYVRHYNNKEKRHYLEAEKVSKTNFNITNGILSGTVYTYDFSKRHEDDNCYNMRDYNKKWFTDPNKAEARLAKLKGGRE